MRDQSPKLVDVPLAAGTCNHKVNIRSIYYYVACRLYQDSIALRRTNVPYCANDSATQSKPQARM
jgi:hypothetical protein